MGIARTAWSGQHFGFLLRDKVHEGMHAVRRRLRVRGLLPPLFPSAPGNAKCRAHPNLPTLLMGGAMRLRFDIMEQKTHRVRDS